MSPSIAELVKLLPPPPPPTPALPTGVAALDAVLLGGGLPRGRLTEIAGPTGSGKTTLARAIVEATVAAHGWVAYVDAQCTLDARDWVHLGDEEGVWIIRPKDASRAPWCADVLLRSGAFALVVLDGAPMLSKGAAVRLTRLARESNAALVLLGDRTGAASQLGGAVRLLLERPTPGSRRPRPHRPPPITDHRSPITSSTASDPSTTPVRTISVRVEKGGTLRTVEVRCAIGVARRLCTHPEVPDRRGVARGPAGGNRRAHARRAASPPADVAGRGTAGLPLEPITELRTAVARARALG
ncbi:MAG TPA: AAA family ATPase [Gemmatimonadaceae bacterium]|nr:AAA family ATPase [Gemmatimonadaceae bacterium]